MPGPVGALGPTAPPADSTTLENLSAVGKIPTLDGNTAIALAHVSTDPSVTVENGHALAQVGKTAKTANALSQLDPQDQANVHARLTADITTNGGSATRLASVGYDEPVGPEGPIAPKPAPAPGGGVFHDIVGGLDEARRSLAPASDLHALGNVLRPAGAIIPSGIRSGVHQVLKGVNEAAAIVPHAYRAAEYRSDLLDPGHASGSLFDQIGGSIEHPGATVSLWKHFFTIKGLAQAWRSTENGATTYDPSVVRVLQNKYTPQTYQLIQAVAEGQDPAELAQNAGSLGPAILAATKNPQFQQAVNQLTSSRTSVGRGLVGTQFIDNHPEAGHALSGTMDALGDWYANPLVLGGAVSKAADLARYSLDANDVQSMYIAGSKGGAVASVKGAVSGTTNIARYFDQAAQVANKGGPTALAQWDPKIAPMLKDLAPIIKNAADQGRELTGADLARGMSGIQGDVALLSGRAGRYFHAKTMVPHLSAIGSALRDGKVLLGKSINWAADLDKITTDLAPGYEARAAEEAAGIPHLTASSTARLDSQAPEYLPRQLAKPSLVRRAVASVPRQIQMAGRLMPTASYVVDGSTSAATNVQRLAKIFLPTARANDIMNAFLYGDDAKKFLVVKGLAAEIFDAAGAADNSFVRDYAKTWLKLMDNQNADQHFLSNGLDVMQFDGAATAMGITEGDMSKAWKLPDWRTTQYLAKKGATMGTLRAGINSAEDFALGIWKGLVIVRPGFALRVGGEELAGALVRNGFVPLLKSYAARSALDVKFGSDDLNFLSKALRTHVQKILNDGLYREIRDAKTAGDEQKLLTLPPEGSQFTLEPWKDWGRILNSPDHPIPHAVLSSIQTPAEHIGAWFAFGPRAILKGVKGAQRVIAGEDYLNAMKLWTQEGNGAEAFHDFVSSMHQPEAGFGDVIDEQTQMANHGMASMKLELRPNGKYKMTGNQDEYFNQKWASRINYLSKSKLIQEAWRHADESLAAQRQAVYKLLSSDEMASVREMSPRATQLPSGASVAAGDATEKQALDDWTDKIIAQANEVVRKDGKLIKAGKGTVLDWAKGGQVDANVLSKIDRAAVPEAVIGPELAPYAVNWFSRALGGAMESWVGKPVDWLSRQPIFLSNYATAVKEATDRLAPKLWDDSLSAEENQAKLDKLVNDIATERAINETLPYIHDIKSRTQFEQAHRRLAPFLFAQRQFYTRWLKNFAHSPQAIARFGTIMNGLRVSGFVHNDPQTGEAYFYYPGSGALTNVVQRALNQLGVPSYLNVPSQFTGEVSGLSPGLTSDMPSASPFVSIGLDSLATLFPGITPIANTLSAGTLADDPNAISDFFQNTASSFLPSIATRIMSALQLTTTGKEEVASDVINAMAYLQAAGHGLPENATYTQRNLYVSRLQTQTTSMLLLRAGLGFITPASPTLNTDALGLDNELQKLLAVMPYDQAISAFVAAYPDGLPYTIGKTASVSGAELPTTAPGLQYMKDNLSFLQNYPSAAPWLIPQSTLTGPYDNAAEGEQLLLGLRQYRDPMTDEGDISSWYNELVYARDATTYFDAEQSYIAASNKPGADYTAMKTNWVKWSGNYLNTHPALKEVLTAAAPAQRRGDVMQDMESAIADKALPKTPTSSAIEELMSGWHAYQQKIGQWTNGQGETISSDASDLWSETQAFVTWGDNYVKAHPQAAPFWSGVLQFQTSW